ncbi:hypothetical protein NOR51B_1165 [Luminiphilus syltensis NOR5-1B]|uniref:Uncharacterized protein n=1 Tax=Luminiphilus syltensis NOR5-1B TaxID=565045 RepID=B8KTE7_9GAMM|nr:hypothetical protein NOR51B_1165 [Luminiphilus syltensis NOR5-1B]
MVVLMNAGVPVFDEEQNRRQRREGFVWGLGRIRPTTVLR